MNEFQTIYRQDYVPKPIKEVAKKNRYVIPSEYKDPLLDPFKKHIDVDESGPDCIEEVKSYYNKAKNKYPCVKKQIPNEEEPVNKVVIRGDQIYNGRSTYQVNFCDIEKEIEFKELEKKNAVVLPLDIFIPLTTQKSGFREPIMINSKAYQRDPVPKAVNNLNPDYKVREILNVTTGWSDYTNKIGNLGKMITEQELYGPVHHDFKGKFY